MTGELRALAASIVFLVGCVFCFPLYLIGKGEAATDILCQIARRLAGKISPK